MRGNKKEGMLGVNPTQNAAASTRQTQPGDVKLSVCYHFRVCVCFSPQPLGTSAGLADQT